MINIPFLTKVQLKYNTTSINIFIVIAAVLLTALIYKTGSLVLSDSLKFGFFVFVLIYFLKIYEKESHFRKSAIWGYIIFLISISIFLSVKIVRNNILNPHEWDFLCFYLFGKVSISGLNFYDAKNYIDILNSHILPFIPSTSFVNSALAFQYMPPSIFYFIPLGLFDFNSANYMWLAVNLLFLSLDIIILNHFFLKDKGFLFFLSIISLFLLLPGTQHALFYEQTTFIILFLILLIWKNRDLPVSGLWLSIAMFTKPIMAIFFIYPLLRRKWKSIFVALITTIFLILITLLIFGPSVFITFLTKNPNMHLQNIEYTEWENQSLLATILRVTKYDFSYASPLLHPFFLVSAFILCAISFWFIYKAGEDKSEWAFSIVILLALIIYPGSINSYGPMLFPVIIFLFAHSNRIFRDDCLFALTIAFIYGIMFINPFISYLFFWTMLIFIIATNYKLQSGIKLAR